jgi:hypothetical protein
VNTGEGGELFEQLSDHHHLKDSAKWPAAIPVCIFESGSGT